VDERDRVENERRRSPRFNCGGRAKIYCLPFDGDAIFLGTLRNLSSGGICLAMGPLFEPGSPMEVVVKVNSTSFRAGAVVRAQRGPSATSLEFVQISAGAKDVLEDVLFRLAKVQELNRRLRESRLDEETERMLAEQGRLPVMRLAPGGMAMRASATSGLTVVTVGDEVGGDGQMEDAEAPVIDIDLFG
jgi:hypothetical protein